MLKVFSVIPTVKMKKQASRMEERNLLKFVCGIGNLGINNL